MAKKKSKKRKSAKVSGSKAKLDGDLKVERADETGVPEVEVDVTSEKVGTGEPRPFKSADIGQRDDRTDRYGASPPAFGPEVTADDSKVACVAIGKVVTLNYSRGSQVKADVVNVMDGMVTFRVRGSNAKLQKLEAEVLADLQRGGNTVRMEF